MKKNYCVRRSSKNQFEEEINPTDSVINIVDVMLVFSCGLLLALVMFWNVDLTTQNLVSLEQGADVSQVDEIQDKIEQNKSGGSGYEKMGTVYKDPVTGKLYMLEGE